jgi:uncharacterized damage-inducible protein DinB
VGWLTSNPSPCTRCARIDTIAKGDLNFGDSVKPMGLPESTAIRLRTQLGCLPTILAGISEDSLDRRPLPEKWSARENLAHLARYHEMFLERIERIRREDRPLLARYVAEDDPKWPQWAAVPVGELLTRLRALRAQMLELVQQLSDAELSRTAVHSRFGEMTLVEWLEFFLLHEAHHLLVVMQRARE